MAKRVSWSFLKTKGLSCTTYMGAKFFCTEHWPGLLREHFGSVIVCLCIFSDAHDLTHKIFRYVRISFLMTTNSSHHFQKRALLHFIIIINHACVSELICLRKPVEGELIFICWWVKRPTHVLNVLWPCKYLPVIHCRQTLCRGRRRPVESRKGGS